MSKIFQFIKSNAAAVIIITCLSVVAIVIIVYFLKRQKKVEVKAQFEQGIERFDKRYMKKCKHCGQSVPVDDNICMSCGEIPN